MKDDLIGMSLDEKAELFVDNVFRGKHHLRKFRKENNHWVCVPFGSVATYDDDTLTRIVVESHRIGLRAEIDNYGMLGIKILLHNRTCREGRLWERHPTIEQVVS